MHLTTKNGWRMAAAASAMLFLALLGCKGKTDAPSADGEKKAFTPFVIEDSSKIVTYPDGLKLYVVSPGPGDYPTNGMHVTMNYQGRLDDGTIFDESYTHEKPFSFTMGTGGVIAGIEAAVKKLRLGSKAIAMIPPSLGYGDGKGKNGLPPKIPANAHLTFHLELVGTF